MIKINGREHDLGGGMFVRRVLPERQKRMIGPICFLDHMGPVTIAAGQNVDVRPHPHIGLSTLTFLLEGHLVHRDSVGSNVRINPGEVNWMVAGRGVSHSERADKSELNKERKFHGLQFWIALPDGQEEVEPSFYHYDKNQIPVHEDGTRKITVVVGEAFDLVSAVKSTSPMLFALIETKEDFEFDFSNPLFELGVYVVEGDALVGSEKIESHQLLVFEDGVIPKIKVRAGSRLALIGGEAFATARYMWWNLVSSSKERLEVAKAQWKDGSFPMVPGETEFIPLPE